MLPSPPPSPGSLSPAAEGCGHTSLPQPSWITHVTLIPFTLSVKPARTGLTCTQRHTCRHTRTRAQVPVLDKVEVLASSDPVAHIMGSPISFYQPRFALITIACPKALSPCAATRPQQLCVRDHRLMHAPRMKRIAKSCLPMNKKTTYLGEKTELLPSVALLSCVLAVMRNSCENERIFIKLMRLSIIVMTESCILNVKKGVFYNYRFDLEACHQIGDLCCINWVVQSVDSCIHHFKPECASITTI